MGSRAFVRARGRDLARWLEKALHRDGKTCVLSAVQAFLLPR